MAEDPRALIRTAQAAELARDLAGAAGLLRRAAALYRAQGSGGRAEQLERHAERLAPAEDAGASAPDRRPETSKLDLGVSALDRRPETSKLDLGGSALDRRPETSTCGSGLPTATGLQGTRGPSTGSGETAPTGEVHPVRDHVNPDRGPELASLALEAWCSFCCLPSTEVGRLVTGPTGAFICAGCVEESRTSLRSDGVAAAPAASAVSPELPGPLYPAHREALAEVDAALARGARRLLVLGASGAGLSRLVAALASTGTWSRASRPAGRALLTEESLLSVGDPQTLRALASGSFLLAADGVLRARRTVLGVALPTTGELAEATGHRLPYALLEAVEAIIPLRASTEAELLETAPALLRALVPERTVSDGLLRELVSAAQEAAHPVLELEALIRRLPPGRSERVEERT